MAPAARWIVGIVLALVAAGLWMGWSASRDSPTTARSVASAPPATAQDSTTAKSLASAEKQAMADVATAMQPIVPKAELESSAAAAASKASEPVTAAVYFEFDRSGLRSDELPKLDALAARIKDRSFDRLDAVGYADRIGEEPYNDQLSRKRADAVVAYLVAKGLDAGRMRAEARGERESTAGGACKELGADDGKNRKLVDCLQRDRYVQIVLR